MIRPFLLAYISFADHDPFLLVSIHQSFRFQSVPMDVRSPHQEVPSQSAPVSQFASVSIYLYLHSPSSTYGTLLADVWGRPGSPYSPHPHYRAYRITIPVQPTFHKPQFDQYALPLTLSVESLALAMKWGNLYCMRTWEGGNKGRGYRMVGSLERRARPIRRKLPILSIKKGEANCRPPSERFPFLTPD